MKLLQFWYLFHGFVIRFWSFLTKKAINDVKKGSKRRHFGPKWRPKWHQNRSRGCPRGGFENQVEKKTPRCLKVSSSRSTSGPQNRHVCTLWCHFFDVFSSLFFDWFFNGFLVDFSTIFGLFFNDFSCFVRCLFEVVFLMIFYGIFDRSLDCVNLKIIEISLVFIGYFALGTFCRRSIFRQISCQFRDHFRIDFSSIFMTF